MRIWVAFLLAGCAPDLGSSLSLVAAPRVLAVRGVPAEAAPGATVIWDALVASPDGSAPPLAWSLCTHPKPLANANSVSDECLGAAPGPSLGSGTGVSGALPSDACELFGSELPPTTSTTPDARPHAPDATGGYYQPVRADLGDAITIELQRIRCRLVGASMAAALDYATRYHDNQNPTIAALDATLDGEPVSLDAVPPSRTLTLTVSWPDAAAETFPVFDVESQTIVDHREAMRVSWFASDGAFSAERTGTDESDATLTSANEWTAPASGSVRLWVVLRDSRGGATWIDQTLQISPGS
jgi:hypothetical protein